MGRAAYVIFGVLLIHISSVETQLVNGRSLTPEQIQTIVDVHNVVRGRVSPSSSNMRKIVWNPALAEIAQNNSEKCTGNHYSTGYGENIWSGRGEALNFETAVYSWEREKYDYNYNDNTCDYVCGHYTQAVWAQTYEVGCGGMTGCDHYYTTQIYCNYHPAGNVVGWFPYKSGSPCDKCGCGFTCDNGLCVKTWNATLAAAAQAQADACNTKYQYGDGITTFKSIGGIDMAEAIDYWVKVEYNYMLDTCTDGRWWCALEYKQVVSAGTDEVGCGATIDCPDRYNVMIWCKFFTPRTYGRPYKNGTQCSECECGYSCSDGLCVQGDTTNCLQQSLESTITIFNTVRRTVQSSNMRLLKWNAALAVEAQREADTCNTTFRYGNGATTYRSIGGIHMDKAIDYWVNVPYNYSLDTCTNGRWWCALEYKQVMNARTAEVGCGATVHCSGKQNALIWCKYDLRRRSDKPYIAGIPCSDCLCAESCDNGLCVKGNDSYCLKEQMRKALDIFNAKRRNANPQASNMKALTWNDALAQEAQAEANACNITYQYGKGATTYRSIGGIDMNKAINYWVDVPYNYATDLCTDGRWWCPLEYKQAMNAMTDEVGCGATTSCSGKFNVLIWCKYFRRAGTERPFLAGTPCLECPCGYTCQNSLCVKGNTTNCLKEEMKKFLNKFNTARTSVNPTATNMRKLRWNEALAEEAQTQASLCNATYMYGIGAVTYKSTGDIILNKALSYWTSGRSPYDFNTDTCLDGKWWCAHEYKQVVNAKTEEVGCGAAVNCPGNNNVMIWCLFDIRRNNHQPYKSGTQCSECPCGYSCDQGLCVKGNTTDCFKQEMLQKLNSARRSVTPQASNMRLLTWDASLATAAQTKANACNGTYQYGKKATTYKTAGGIDIDKAVNFWVNVSYNYESDSCTDGRWWCSLEYKQVVNAKTEKVGCGATVNCNRNYNVLIWCIYDILRNNEQPYKNGTSCSECPCGHTCENGLCVKGDTSDCFKIETLAKFNAIRRTATPTPSNMKKLIWNTQLASAAQILANNCNTTYRYGNGATLFRSIGGIDIEKALNYWANVQYNYASDSCTDGRWWCSLEYKQVMYARNEEIGCGATMQCNYNYNVVVWCLYKTPRSNEKPYKTGTACNDCLCGYTCDNGLCVKGDTSDCRQQELTNALTAMNSARTAVSPTATNMKSLSWSSTLSAEAQNFTDNCVFGYASSGVGETKQALYGDIDMQSIVQTWVNQIQHYTYSNDVCEDGYSCVDYKQIVNAKTEEVGCGFTTTCPRPHNILILCKFLPPRSYWGTQPYVTGNTCADCGCGYTCVNGLCVKGNDSQCYTPDIDCYTGRGVDYKGTGNVGLSGNTCVDNKYCRNYEAWVNFLYPGCYTSQGWENCNIPSCDSISAELIANVWT